MAVSLDDFLSDKASATLAGSYLNVTTNHDGFTGTWNGNNFYTVVKNSDGSYYVSPVTYDDQAGKFVEAGDPIIYYDGTTLFYVTNTRIDPYNAAITNSKVVASADVEDQIAFAFEAFVHDCYANNTYDIFINGESEILSNVDDIPDMSDTTSTEAPTTVAPTTQAPTTKSQG